MSHLWTPERLEYAKKLTPELYRYKCFYNAIENIPLIFKIIYPKLCEENKLGIREQAVCNFFNIKPERSHHLKKMQKKFYKKQAQFEVEKIDKTVAYLAIELFHDIFEKLKIKVLEYQCDYFLNEFVHGIKQISEEEIKIPLINILILIRGVYHMHQRQLELKQTTRTETIFQRLYFDSSSIQIPQGFDLKFFELMMGNHGTYSSEKNGKENELSDFLQCDSFGYSKGHQGSYRRSAKLFLMLLDEISRDPDLSKGLNVFNVCEYFCKRKAIDILVSSKFFMFLTVCSDIIANEINIGEIDIDML